ncbi:MAG: hypothetical protein V4519_03520 [Patescibacteria group bacterium]
MRTTISQDYPQFTSEEALFLVTGKQDAKFYHVYDATIELVDDISIPHPKYSDREGSYASTSRNGMIQSGSSLTDLDRVVIRDFITALKHHLKMYMHMHKKNIDTLYLFTPDHMKNYILDALPTELRSKVSYIFAGNYYHEHPEFFLQKIQDQAELNNLTEPQGEAKKILDNSYKARRAKFA